MMICALCNPKYMPKYTIKNMQKYAEMCTPHCAGEVCLNPAAALRSQTVAIQHSLLVGNFPSGYNYSSSSSKKIEAKEPFCLSHHFKTLQPSYNPFL